MPYKDKSTRTSFLLDELRFTANQWRMKVSDPILETKLAYFLDLVDNFPPFSVGRFFVAAKARLIDIASFIATYLIILLQFRAGENGKKENNSTCGAESENTSSLDNIQ
ncbi:uncharacterized protein [Palaemon carinicauda]|uniref:uncharacterized protein n=1 Tax=Palaemon carinicauda TaxID=392227 RepID=UPI0035B5CD63